MNGLFRHAAALILIPGTLLVGGSAVLAQNPISEENSAVVQARGPVHEAFAQPSEMLAVPGPVVAKQPPDPIAEVPPDQKPEGNVLWIPGYWAWDADRGDYLWVSGVWRLAPPNRQWMPGAWNAVEGGWQWTPGFWAPQGVAEMPVQPPPPESVDSGPSAPAPDDNSFYIPGVWLYRNQSYAWRPGFWTAFRPGWVWTPACYFPTPSGSTFVDGYWDYPLETRGVLYAPVYFNQPLWQTPGWYYRPRYCVTPGALTSSLFVGPGGRGFWFGNYQGAAWRTAGFRPWYAARAGGSLFSYYRWSNRADRGWSGRLSTAWNTHALIRPAAQVHNLVHLNHVQIQAHQEHSRGFYEAAQARAAYRVGAHAAGHAGLSVHSAARSSGHVGAGVHISSGAAAHYHAPRPAVHPATHHSAPVTHPHRSAPPPAHHPAPSRSGGHGHHR